MNQLGVVVVLEENRNHDDLHWRHLGRQHLRQRASVNAQLTATRNLRTRPVSSPCTMTTMPSELRAQTTMSNLARDAATDDKRSRAPRREAPRVLKRNVGFAVRAFECNLRTNDAAQLARIISDDDDQRTSKILPKF